MGRGLYIHIPFCEKKCNYCDFTSFTDIKKIDEYLNLLEREIKIYDSIYTSTLKLDIDTIFIGGGTPSVLSASQLKRLLDIIKSNFNITKTKECTIECNPGTVDLEKLEIMKKNGVNRISFGLQAIQEKHLKFMGRIHSKDEFEKSYYLARNVGFENINIDLIFAFYGQTEKDFNETLEYAIKINPEHLSIYSLIIEKNTMFYKYLEEGKIKEFEEDTYVNMYRKAVEFLKENGYSQYEISNYCKSDDSSVDYRCMHNIKYWLCEEYYGFGISASGYINGIRYTNFKKYDDYKSYILKKELPIGYMEVLSSEDIYNEKIMLGLRMNEGIDIDVINSIENIDVRKDIKLKIDNYIVKKIIQYKKNRYFLTQKGREISNSIIIDLMI